MADQGMSTFTIAGDGLASGADETWSFKKKKHLENRIKLVRSCLVNAITNPCLPKGGYDSESASMYCPFLFYHMK